MKYVCLGYYDKDKLDGMTEAERNAMFDACFEYDDRLRANGYSARWRSIQTSGKRVNLLLEERESRDDRRSLCGNQGATRRHCHA